MITPRISLVAYEDRQQGFVFVQVPNERGRYVRTDPSVVLVACPFCKATVGEPCHNGDALRKYFGVTHSRRRELADRRRRNIGAKPLYRLINGEPVLIAEGTL